MSISWFISNIANALLLPPLNLLLLVGAGLLMRRRWPRFGLALGSIALLALCVFSTTAAALLIVTPLETRSTPLASAKDTGAQAIVVLTGGRLANAPEYGGSDIPNHAALARIRYAAKLYRETGLPLLVTGGAPDGSNESEAAVVRRVLQEDFRVPVKWLEEKSDNTAESAQLSASILKQAGANRILLVTDAIHMPRSQSVFTSSGLDVIAAPTIFYSRDRLRQFTFLPDAEGLRLSRYALHEWIGIAWYWVRHGRSSA